MRVKVEPELEVSVEVDDYLWPWEQSTPVFMHHGMSRNASFWRRWIPILGETRRVYRPDMRGVGKSDVPKPDQPYHLDKLVADLDRVFEAAKLDRVHWVGESSGGMLGVLYASLRPERFASVTLINTPVRTLANATAHGINVGEDTIAGAIMKYGTGGWCERTLAQRLDKDIAPPELQAFYIEQMGNVPSYIAAGIHNAIEDLDLFPVLSKMRMPYLLLTGDKKKSTVEAQHLMVDQIPKVELKIFAGYGNALGTIAPERSAREALAFWERVENAPETIGKEKVLSS